MSTPPHARGRVLLDACVLFPPLVRTILIETAARGAFAPLWSPRIFEEWRIAVGRQHGIPVEAEVVTTQTLLKARFPEALVTPSGDLEAQITLPDPADAHVLAAAVAGEAGVLLTFNLRDFPQRVGTGYGVEIQHPDSFLWSLLSDAPEAVAGAVDQALKTAEIDPERRRSVLKRAKLPRFGKALEASLTS